jgi:hypothetical protein
MVAVGTIKGGNSVRLGKEALRRWWTLFAGRGE